MTAEFKEKYGEWALITGASSGIGKALAMRLAQEGLNIALVARSESALKSTANALENEFGIQTRTIAADVSTLAGIESVITASNDLKVGYFIPNAGVEFHGEFSDIALEDDFKMIDLNIRSVLTLTRHFAQAMRERGQGGILLVSSVIGQMPNPFLSTYAGSKSFVHNYGLSLRYELARHGVDLSVLSPGPTDTPMVAKMGDSINISAMPMALSTPEEVAEEVMQNFPKKPLIIPTRKNRMMVFMATRVMPLRTAIKQGGDMMLKFGKF